MVRYASKSFFMHPRVEGDDFHYISKKFVQLDGDRFAKQWWDSIVKLLRLGQGLGGRD